MTGPPRRAALVLVAALLALLVAPAPPAAASGWWYEGTTENRVWQEGREWADLETGFCVTSVIGGWAYLDRWNGTVGRWEEVANQRLSGGAAGCQIVAFRLGFAAPEHAGEYRYAAWTGAGSGVWTRSNSFRARVELRPPSVTRDPVEANVAAGQPATFVAAASGSAPAPSVRWETSRDGQLWTTAPGASSAAWTMPAVRVEDDGLLVRAVFRRLATSANLVSSTEVFTAAARLSVRPPPTVVEQPADVRALPGEPVALTARAEAPDPVTVRWQALAAEAPGDAWADVPGATEPTLPLVAHAEADGTRYRAVFRSVAGETASQPATLAVVVLPPVQVGVAPRTTLVGALPGW